MAFSRFLKADLPLAIALRAATALARIVLDYFLGLADSGREPNFFAAAKLDRYVHAVITSGAIRSYAGLFLHL